MAGAAPLWRGSRDGWMFRLWNGGAAKTSGGIHCPYAATTMTSGGEGVDLRDAFERTQPGGLEHGDTQRHRRLLDGRRPQFHPAPCGPVRLRNQGNQFAPRLLVQRLQRRDAKIAGAHEHNAILRHTVLVLA